MKPANFAPIYACIYPQLAELVRQHGYALAVHGSLARDFDLVCVPWGDNPSDPQVVVDSVTSGFCIQQVGEPEMKKHERLAYTISLQFGECFLDLSFLPRDSEFSSIRKDAVRYRGLRESGFASDADDLRSALAETRKALAEATHWEDLVPIKKLINRALSHPGTHQHIGE